MITSTQNPKIQQIRTLLSRPKDRQAARQYIAEGIRLVEEAWLAGFHPDVLFFSKDISDRGLEIVEDYRRQKSVVEEVLPSLMDSLTQTETSQGLLAIFPMQTLPLPSNLDFVIIVDNLRDPGNLGTILRTSVAAGVQAVFLTPGTTDPYSPKVLRAGMGAHFHIPIMSLDWPELVAICKINQKMPLKVFLSEMDAEKSTCWSNDLCQPLAVIIGGEADGATLAARQAADELISIPMPGKCESLNAAVAAGIIIFEVVRQRSL